MGFERRLTLAIIMVVFAVISVNCVSGGQHTPDETIQISVDKDIILTGGESAWVTAQLYYKGEPLRKAGVNVTFSCNDSSRATLTRNNYNVTDDSGSTRILLTANDMPGPVKITAVYNDNNGTITNASYVNVSRWGFIAGSVLDKDGAGIPSANVTLWSGHYNDSSQTWENGELIKIPENPQLSNDGWTASAGLFTFYRVPSGVYNILAIKDGHMNSSVVMLDQGTATGLITIPDYKNSGTPMNVTSIPSQALNGSAIWGIVCDQNRASLSNANVSLWYCTYNQSTGIWEKTSMVNIPENPQLAGDGNARMKGVYSFNGIPPGTYYVYAEKNGQDNYAIVTLNNNLAVNFITLVQYYFLPF